MGSEITDAPTGTLAFPAQPKTKNPAVFTPWSVSSAKRSASDAIVERWSSSAKRVDRAATSASRKPDAIDATCELAASDVAFSRAAILAAISSRDGSRTKVVTPRGAPLSEELQ